MQADFNAQLRAATTHLTQADPILARLIAHHGPCSLEPTPNYYQKLVRSIIGQQLSVKAAETIWQRFLALFEGQPPLPEAILRKRPEELRSVGLSGAKVAYVQDLALQIVDGRLEINKLPDLSNQEIIAELTAVKGIGEWTAHMFLIFSLGQLDVLPVGDLGVRTAAMRLYELSDLPSAAQLRELSTARGWRPYESVASWYLWRSLDNQPLQES